MPRNTAEPVLQFRGSKTAMDKYAGPEGEITVDVTSKTVVVQDGTAGGSPLVTTKTAQTISGKKTFTESPLAPTPVVNDSSKALATTEFVAQALENAGIGSVVGTGISVSGISNAVLNGRMKNGYPAYLVMPEVVDIEAADQTYKSAKGKISASTEYNASYRVTNLLRNQRAYSSTTWITQNGVTSGWVEYEFYDGPHNIVGMFMKGMNDNYTYYPKRWQLQGFDEEEGDWVDIYARVSDQSLRGADNNSRLYGRTYWFTENTRKFTRIRLNVESVYSNSTVRIDCLKFYENIVPGQYQHDLAIYASPKEPLEGNFVEGRAGSTEAFPVKSFKITAPVIYHGRKLTELSKNWIYVKGDKTESKHFADKPGGDRYIPFGDTGLFVGSDTRKIHYGTEQDIKNQCLSMFSCSRMNYTTGVTAGAYIGIEGQDFQTLWNNVELRDAPRHRGGNKALYFNGNNNYIITGNGAGAATQTTTFPKLVAHPYDRDFTLELDVNWQGNGPSVDSYGVIFDNGYTNGFFLFYHHRARCIGLDFKNSFGQYTVPFDLSDKKWHNIAVSGCGGVIYIHVDGKCLGAFDGVPYWRPTYRGWCLGRRYETNATPFKGYMDNFRLINGTCLYHGEDYIVPDQPPTAIPDGTLLHDNIYDCVKEYDEATGTWAFSPRLCLGYVQTGRRENLMTNQPRGTFHLRELEGVVTSAWKESGHYDGNSVPASLFNFGHGMAHGYMTPGTAHTTDHYVQFTLEQPVSFERWYLCATNEAFTRFAPKLEVYGVKDDGTEVLLCKRENRDYMDGSAAVYVPAGSSDDKGNIATHTEQGTPYGGVKSIGGDVHYLIGYACLDILPAAKGQKFKTFKLKFPKKAGIPLFKDNAYTRAIVMPFYADGRCEIQSCVSNVIGDTFMVGPVFLSNGGQYGVAMPFGSMPFEVNGAVRSGDANTPYWRRLGNSNHWWTTASDGYHYGSGEELFLAEGGLIIKTGRNYSNNFNGVNWGLSQEASSVGYGEAYIIAKRMY